MHSTPSAAFPLPAADVSLVPFVVRIVDIHGQVDYEPCASADDACRWATDASTDTDADAAIYRLWHVERP